MDRKEAIRSMINNLIDEKSEESEVDFHDALKDAFRERYMSKKTSEVVDPSETGTND